LVQGQHLCVTKLRQRDGKTRRHAATELDLLGTQASAGLQRCKSQEGLELAQQPKIRRWRLDAGRADAR
jgi:hypothetical protein